MATNVGVAVNTIKSWLSLLESSYVVYLLPPYYQSFNKRTIKSPKLFFYDIGLASNLLGIRKADEMDVHFAKGSLFENMILNELIKAKLNKAEVPQLYFWRDQHGHEIDCIIDKGSDLLAIEIKSAATYHKDFLKNFNQWNRISSCTTDTNYLIYGGDESFLVPKGKVISWLDLNKIEI